MLHYGVAHHPIPHIMLSFTVYLCSLEYAQLQRLVELICVQNCIPLQMHHSESCVLLWMEGW